VGCVHLYVGVSRAGGGGIQPPEAGVAWGGGRT
jgi:hypothetical protein